MFALRCTKRLLNAFRTSPEGGDHSPSTALGDWYANVLYARPERLVLCVSEKSLLPLLVPARGGLAIVVDRLRAALAEILPALGIGAEAVEAELSAMDEFRLLTTASRAVLGSMNDFVTSFEHMVPYRPGWSLRDWSIHLSETPRGPLQMRFFAEVAKELLSVPM